MASANSPRSVNVNTALACLFFLLSFNYTSGMFLPPKYGSMPLNKFRMRVPGGPVAREVVEDTADDFTNVARQFRENIDDASPEQPTSVIGTILAKWLVAEYNREGAIDNVVYKLLQTPSSDCEGTNDYFAQESCQVQMFIAKAICEPRKTSNERCRVNTVVTESCLAKFSQKSLTIIEPVICQDVAPSDDNAFNSYLALPHQMAGQEKQMYEKKWGVHDGRVNPFVE